MVEPLKQEIPEIIRCKDCVHYDDNRCELHEYLHFKENDFCSYAERKKRMKIMTYSKAKTKCEGIINSFNNCDKLYQDCSECPLNAMIVMTDNEEYTTLCHLLCFFKDDIKDKIDKALS